MANLRIDYRDGGYEPAVLHASLVYKGKDADIPIEITEIKHHPSGILRLEKDVKKSTVDLAVYNAHPDHDLLADNRKFWREIWSLTGPVKVTVRAKPAKGYAKPKFPVIERHAHIDVRPPEPEVHWYDMRTLPPTRDPNPIQVRADGEDHFELRVECTMWLPETRRFEYDADVVEFTHFTGKQFHADVFGPSPNSRPWVVARPGSPDNREFSWWESKSALPMEQYPKLKPPVRDTIRVRVWPRNSIVQRSPNDIDVKPGTVRLAEAHVPVQLDPELVEAEVIEPKEPIPADGKMHSVELEIRRRRDKSLFKNGELSFKLETGGDLPGGTITPEQIIVKESDNGRVRLEYTPRALKYRPGRTFEQPLQVSVGAGVSAVDADTVTLNLSPALQVKIDAEKCGLDWPQPYELSFFAGETPCEIEGHIGIDFHETLADKDCQRSVGDARPILTVVDENGEHPVTLEARTCVQPADEAGRFTWHLPELEKGLRSLPESRRLRKLREFDESPRGEPDTDSLAVLAGYRAVLDSEAGVRLFRPSRSGCTIMDAVLEPRLVGRGMEMAGQLAQMMETDCEKVRGGTTLLDAGLFGTILVEEQHRTLLNDGIDLAAKFFWDLFEFLDIAGKFGEGVLKRLPNAPGWLGGWIRQFIAAVKAHPVLGPRVGWALTKLELLASRIASGAGELGAMLKEFWTELLERFTGRLRSFLSRLPEWLGTTLGKDAANMAGKLLEAVTKLFTGFTTGQLASMPTSDHVADLIRQYLGDIGVAVTEAVDSASSAVSSLSFSPSDKQSCGSAAAAYLEGVVDLGGERAKLMEEIAMLDKELELLSETLDCMFILCAIAALFVTGGWSSPAIVAVQTAGGGKVFVNIGTHLYQAFKQCALAGALDEKYLRLTKELTR